MEVFSFSIIWQSMKGGLNKHSDNIKIVSIKRRNSEIHYCGGVRLCYISRQESFPIGVKD